MPQDHLNQSFGAIQGLEQSGSELHIQTAEAKVRLKVFSEEIIQVRALALHREWEDFSYSLQSSGEEIEYEWLDQGEFYLLKTQKIHLEVQKSPFRLKFRNSAGQVLNEDDPGLGLSMIGNEISNYKKIQPGERFLGLGEKTGNLDRRGQHYTCWNTDYFGYGPDSDPLYVSIPFFMGVLPEIEETYGIFLDNTYRSEFNFGASSNRFSYFKVPDGELNYYFIGGGKPARVLENYTYLTGRIPLPPQWSLGYQQCRYSYYPESEVLNVARNFRERDIPADVIYLDIHYMERYKVFTWDEERFPKPAELLQKLQEMGFHVVLILDPGVKVEEGYKLYEEGLEKDYFVKYPDGEVYQGEVWPGWCHFPDFTKPEVREWWGEQYQSLIDEGVRGFWNDMNEPAVWGKNFPDAVEFDYEGHKASHKKAHNVYGMQMVRSTFEATREKLKGERPFVLTRAGFAGVQRYAAVWTGDNVSSDDLMLSDVRILNSMGLSGLAFSGCDVGGFVGESNTPLFNRWIALGAFAPFYRGHTMINSRDAEPWAFGEESEEIARNYIKLRYRLMPYIYSVFYEASQNGMPVQRSLAFDFSQDPKIYDYHYQNQYLFGPNILVCPIDTKHAIYKAYLPQGKWYDLFNDQEYAGNQEVLLEVPNDKLPLFVRGGSLLCLQKGVSHQQERPDPQMELHVYWSEEEGQFEYYEDDGITYEYEQGNFYKRILHFKPEEKSVIFTKSEGKRDSKFQNLRIYWHGFPEENLDLHWGEQSLEIHREDYRFVEPISNFDPYEYAEDFSKTLRNLPYSDLEWKAEEMRIFWG